MNDRQQTLQERMRISTEIDARVNAGRGVPECFSEAQTLDWVKRNIVLRDACSYCGADIEQTPTGPVYSCTERCPEPSFH